MDNEIKKALLDVTPDLEKSKSRVKRAVLQPESKPNKMFYFPQIMFGCFILLSFILVTTKWQSDHFVQGFSEETLKMYGLLDDGDHTQRYQKDLIIAKYGEVKGIKVNKVEIENLIESYKSQLPSTFNKVLEKNEITETAYTEQYLTFKAQVQLIRDSLLQNYEKMYPQFNQEIHAQLLLLDAIEEVGHGDVSFWDGVNISAFVIYEGENARILALIDEKRFLEQQLLIMPKRDSLHFKVGDKVLLEKSLITNIRTENNFKQFVVSKDIKVVRDNKTISISAKQQKVKKFFDQVTWQPFSQSEEPNMKIETLSGVYSIWFDDNENIVIGTGDKGFVITKEELQNWGEDLINKNN